MMVDNNDASLRRLLRAASAGGVGVNLASMTDEEIIQRLSTNAQSPHHINDQRTKNRLSFLGFGS